MPSVCLSWLNVTAGTRKLRAFINDEYLPKTRDTFGLDKLPNGQAWYAFNAKQSTTTDLTPAQRAQVLARCVEEARTRATYSRRCSMRTRRVASFCCWAGERITMA